jgi:hypothetical protein
LSRKQVRSGDAQKKAAPLQKQPFVTRCYTYLEMTLIISQSLFE